MTGVITPAGVRLYTGLELTELTELPDDCVIFVEDHVGSGNGDLSVHQHFVDLVQARGTNAPAIAVEYARFDSDPSVVAWPRQAYFVSQTLARYIVPEPWIEKTSAFNFMINKPRLSRTWLIDRLSELNIHTKHYSMAGDDRGIYSRRCWVNDGMRVVSDQILNGRVSNIEIYQSWLRHKVFEPTVFSLVTEPAWNEMSFFISEKTIWAWEAGTIPIWIGSWAAADTMAELGFDVFYDLIDHAYQHEPDADRRLVMALDLNQHLLCDSRTALDFWNQNRSRIEWNRQHMRSGDWFREHARREVSRTGISAQDLAQLMFYTLDDRSNYESNLLTDRYDARIVINNKEQSCTEEPAN